jgi:hypothetical protein
VNSLASRVKNLRDMNIAMDQTIWLAITIAEKYRSLTLPTRKVWRGSDKNHVQFSTNEVINEVDLFPAGYTVYSYSNPQAG